MSRKIISEQLYNLIKEKIESGESAKVVASVLKVSVTLVRKITGQIAAGTAVYSVAYKKREYRASENAIDLQARILNIIESDNSLNLHGVSDILRSQGIHKSHVTVSRCLKKLRITRKVLTKVPEDRNSQRVIDLRYNYGRMMENVRLDKLVFLDETGFNLHSSKTYGYSLINTKAVMTVPTNRGQNISVLAAISTNQIICHKICQGAFNGDLLKEFINVQLAEYFDLNPGSTLVMDNCRFHHRNDVLALLTEKGINYKFLPPYSPMLNPIEEVFSVLKARYYNIRPLSKSKTVLIERVTRLLEDNTWNMEPFYSHMREFLIKTLSRQKFF